MNNLSYKDVKSIAFGRSNRKYHWPIGPNAKWCAWLSLIFIVLWFIAITVLLIQTSSVTNNYKLTYDIPTSGALVLGGHDGADLLDGHLIKPTVDPDAYEWVLSNWVLTPIMTLFVIAILLFIYSMMDEGLKLKYRQNIIEYWTEHKELPEEPKDED